MSATPDAVVEKEIVNVPALISVAGRNFGVIMRQTNGLSHEDSLLQPPFRGNCLNWVMGHIVQSRDRMLRVLGEPSVWTQEQIDRYQRDSAPVLADGSDIIRLDKMVADLKTQQERLVAKLQMTSPEDLDVIGKEVIKGITDWTVGEWLHFLLWHETYHLGNLEFTRQLSGVNDKVI